MRILDLFCCAGGAAEGYHRAWPDAEIVGVDIKPQPNYPFTFVQGDALAYAAEHIGEFDFVHASPPCQVHSTQTADRSKHIDLIPPTREILAPHGDRITYVIENVEGARKSLINPVRLCGSSFGLDVRRHRYFETNRPFVAPPCDHAWQTPRFRSLRMNIVREGRLSPVVGVHGHINYAGEFELRCAAMGIDWMTNAELTQAIPPAYTEYIGNQLKTTRKEWYGTSNEG